MSGDPFEGLSDEQRKCAQRESAAFVRGLLWGTLGSLVLWACALAPLLW